MVKNLPAVEETSPLPPTRLIETIERELVNIEGYPAGGAVAALVAGLAASLAAAAADRSREDWDEAAGARAQAQALARRAGALAEWDATEYARAREALASRGPSGPEDAGSDWRLGMAIERAAAPPLALAATAADVAELAAGIATWGAADVKPDAAIAAGLAAAAARAAAGLVRVNLVLGGDRAPAARADAYADAAAAASALASEKAR
jgi:formiminotetrahydrofolate cyclodeaminase